MSAEGIQQILAELQKLNRRMDTLSTRLFGNPEGEAGDGAKGNQIHRLLAARLWKGGLQWDDVRLLMEKYLAKLTDTEVCWLFGLSCRLSIRFLGLEGTTHCEPQQRSHSPMALPTAESAESIS